MTKYNTCCTIMSTEQSSELSVASLMPGPHTQRVSQQRVCVVEPLCITPVCCPQMQHSFCQPCLSTVFFWYFPSIKKCFMSFYLKFDSYLVSTEKCVPNCIVVISNNTLVLLLLLLLVVVVVVVVVVVIIIIIINPAIPLHLARFI